MALITGASGGIGRVLARRYAAYGATVILVARRGEELAHTARLVANDGHQAMQLVADIRVEHQCREVVTKAMSRFGRLDILVNNAGVPGVDQAVADATVANWQDVLDTNLLAPMLLSREVLQHAMIDARRGNIQFMSSLAANSALPRKAHYAAAKSGLSALSRTLATEVGELGIRVNTLVIGTVAGELVDSYIARLAHEQRLAPDVIRRRLASANALGRLVLPEEVADTSLWLASDAAAAITGQDIFVTGGQRNG
ncbi:short-chain dehydrogenase [Mycobacterium tuberculosis variant microti OV254]|nr:short-chain dehydrogenase [Mycobacterium tuberculosis variant microti OV254]